MKPSSCPTCGQSIKHFRAGIYLPPLKALIFDLIKAGGEMGATGEEVRSILRENSPYRKATGVGARNHIFQINDLLCETEYRIEARGGSNKYSNTRHWVLVREKVK
jgi:hypothetical protein